MHYCNGLAICRLADAAGDARGACEIPDWPALQVAAGRTMLSVICAAATAAAAHWAFSCKLVDNLSTNCRPTVDQLSTNYLDPKLVDHWSTKVYKC